MTQQPNQPTADELFASAVEPLLGEREVETAKMFGSQGLKMRGKVFAMLVKGKLVVKLPRERAAALLASGAGEPFDPGHGRVMKQWVAVRAGSADWGALAAEALALVSGTR